MLITSEYFAGRAPTEADHSGPLLGLAAACERTLYDLYFDKLFSTHPNTFSDKSTFGSCIYWLRDSTRPTPRTAQGSTLKIVGKRVTEPLIAMLEDLNKNFRIPAAHRDLVDQRMWAAGRALVIGNGDLLVYLVEALTRDS